MPIIHTVFRGFVQTRRILLADGIPMGERDARPSLGPSICARRPSRSARSPDSPATSCRQHLLPPALTAAINRKSGPRSARRETCCLLSTTFAIRCAAASRRSEAARSAIQSSALNLPFRSHPPTSARFGPTPTCLSGRAPVLAARPRREQVGAAFLHRLEELIAVGNNCAQEGRETERALSNPEFIGLDVPRGGRDLQCRPTSASFACRTRTTAIRNRRSRCGDSFFARVSGPYPRPGRTPPRNRGEPNPTDALAPNSASRAGHRPILQNHAERLLKRQDPDQSD